jgi:8-oxo-dGTP pyrophosphatase MutT (NUDIX family)
MSEPNDAERPTQLNPWTVRSSRHVLYDRWLKVRADDCVTSKGAEVTPFYVLEYPDWVHIVAIDEQERVILAQQYRHGIGGISLELPAGAIESGESPLQAAARELAEETGYVADELSLVTTLSPNPATHANRFHVVLARSAKRMGPPACDPTEEINVVRASMEDVVEHALTGKILHSLHIASLAVALGSIGRWSFMRG